MRFAIYARYSSDRQSERSIDDQVRLCRERVAAAGGTVTEVYSDYAISGASLHRPGIRALIEDARTGRFEAVMTEALDRISRDQEDTAGVFKRLRFAGVRILTAHEGEVTELHVGLRGTMNALFLKDLGDKVRRGQSGRAADGLAPGGLSYGYEMVREIDATGELLRGRRRIRDDQAAVVRRIFADYVAGISPRAIAAALNREGVASPRGGQWNASTINGNRGRANGILNNALYAGRLVYNRQRFIKDPDTGKRQARPNPKSEWLTAEVPELRIVDDATWTAAQALKAATAPVRAPSEAHRAQRPKHLFSGLLVCGSCGRGMTVIRPGRVGCSSYRERGTCDNRNTVALDALEERILEGLRRHLVHPEAVAEFVREFHAELARQSRERQGREANAVRELKDAEGRIARIVAAIEEGTETEEMRVRLRELDARRRQLRSESAAAAGAGRVLALHPNVAEVYRRKVQDLQAALAKEGAGRLEAIAAIRSMVDKIILRPGPARGQMAIELHGKMAAALDLASGGHFDPGMLTVVAGRGFEPLTFRL